MNRKRGRDKTKINKKKVTKRLMNSFLLCFIRFTDHTAFNAMRMNDYYVALEF